MQPSQSYSSSFSLLSKLWPHDLRPHVDLWPTSIPVLFLFFAFIFYLYWRLVVHIFRPFFATENPTFSLSAPRTQTVYSAPTGMGKVTPRSLFLVCDHHPVLICMLFLLFTAYIVCMCMCLCLSFGAPLCSHGDTELLRYSKNATLASLLRNTPTVHLH